MARAFSFQLFLDSISSKGGLLTGEQQRGQRPAVNLGRFNLTRSLSANWS